MSVASPVVSHHPPGGGVGILAWQGIGTASGRYMLSSASLHRCLIISMLYTGRRRIKPSWSSGGGGTIRPAGTFGGG
jgi:hypothetical protein